MKIETGTSCKLYTLNEFELEQHEAEIRKPLEDEIVKLTKELKQLSNELRKQSEEVKKQSQQLLNEKLQFLATKESECQKVITELEEWVDNESKKYVITRTKIGEGIFKGRHKVLEDFKQKLNEMKGEN